MTSEFSMFIKLLNESGLKIAMAWLNARLKTVVRLMYAAKRLAKDYIIKKPELGHVFQCDFERLQKKSSRMLQMIDLYETSFENQTCKI